MYWLGWVLVSCKYHNSTSTSDKVSKCADKDVDYRSTDINNNKSITTLQECYNECRKEPGCKSLTVGIGGCGFKGNIFGLQLIAIPDSLNQHSLNMDCVDDVGTKL